MPSNFASPNFIDESLSPGDFQYHSDNALQQQGRLFGEMYSTREAQLSTATLTQQGLILYSGNSSMTEQIPWNSQQAQLSAYVANAHAGHVAYEPDRGLPYRIHVERERTFFDDTGQWIAPRTFGPQPLNVVSESKDDGLVDWSGESSYAWSPESPHSLGSPLSYAASPTRTRAEHHPHMLSGFLRPEETKPKPRRRKLTDAEKLHAKDVRDSKACWACHLSKTKVGQIKSAQDVKY